MWGVVLLPHEQFARFIALWVHIMLVITILPFDQSLMKWLRQYRREIQRLRLDYAFTSSSSDIFSLRLLHTGKNVVTFFNFWLFLWIINLKTLWVTRTVPIESSENASNTSNIGNIFTTKINKKFTIGSVFGNVYKKNSRLWFCFTLLIYVKFSGVDTYKICPCEG